MGIAKTIIDQPEEFSPLVQMAWAAHKAKRLPKEPNLAFCYDMLNRVSRRCTHFLVCSIRLYLRRRMLDRTMTCGDRPFRVHYVLAALPL